MEKLPLWVRQERGYWLRLPAITVIYFMTAKFGLSLAHTTRQITAVWPPSGLALVVLLLLGYSYWPAIVLGAFAANWSDNEPVLVAAVIAVGNTLEAVAGAWIVKRLGNGGRRMNTPRMAGAVGVAAVLSSLVAATIGSLSLVLGHVITRQSWASNWFTWWAGDVLGIVLFAPTLLVLLDREAYRQARSRPLETGLMLASVFAASMVLFTVRPEPYTRLHFYLLFPFMVWAALRFTRLGVAACTMVISGVGIWACVNGLGPIGVVPIDRSLIQFLLFVLVTAASSLLLAMTIEQRQAAVTALEDQTRHLQALDDELKDANRRVTDILASILRDGDAEDGRQGQSRRKG